MSARIAIERMIADWLILDVNTRIAAVPRDTNDPPPPLISAFSDPTYPATTIAVFDPSRHFWVAERKEPPAAPALYVICQGVISMMGEPYPAGNIRASTVPLRVAIRYITTDRDTAVARRDGEYTLRAVARSLRELSLNAHGDTERVRIGHQFVLGESPMEFFPVIETIGNARVAGAVVINYLTRDQQPQYT